MQCGHIASVKLLLANGATVDFRLPHGGNAFHVAAQLGREEVGQMVLEEGARSGLPTLMALLTMKDKAGRKPVDLAAEEKHPAFLEMLAAFISPPPPREPAHFAAIKKLAIFFEDVSHSNGWAVTVAALTVDRCCGQVSSGGAETRHVKPVTIRTMAGAAAQQCLDALREGDAIAR